MRAHPAVTAALFVLLGAADWELVARDPAGPVERICAKSQAVCELAAAGIDRGWWAPDLHGRELRCEPRPGCFPAESLVIPGFNDPDTLARRR